MPGEPEQLRIHVNERESVSSLLYLARKANRMGVTLLLGHGAGGNQLAGFMRLFAGGLATRGLDTATFNFLYSEHGRGSPDPPAKLESCYRAVMEELATHKKLRGNRLVVGGKSMGGRIGSQVIGQAARLSETNQKPAIKAAGKSGQPAVDGLVFLGYPLHPPGRPEQLRDQHLKAIQAPMLFLQGTRDSFGSAEEFRAVIKKHKLPATLYLIEGGDHSFKVNKGAGVPQPQVYESAMDEIVNWLALKLFGK